LPDLKKRLGQHHLRSSALCGPLLDFLQPAGHRVLEIGPGGGVLTRALIESGARVMACELDLAWALALRFDGRLAGVALAVGDAMRLGWNRIPEDMLVAGNLPYGIATALIDQLLSSSPWVPRAGFLVQLEVGKRLVARPGDPDYGATSVLTRARADVAILGRVAKGSFRPPPRVDGAFVGLSPKTPPLPELEMAEFTRVVRTGFGQRRKTLRNSIGRACGRQRTSAALEKLGFDARSRAEELSLEEWLDLFHVLRCAGGSRGGALES